MRPYNLATVPLLHPHGRHCYHDVAVAYGQTRGAYRYRYCVEQYCLLKPRCCHQLDARADSVIGACDQPRWCHP
jgi:hypothetical protein